MRHMKIVGGPEVIGIFLGLCHVVFSFAHKEVFIYPTIVEERTTAGRLTLRLNDDITLNLERSSVLAENLRFVTNYKGGHVLSTIDTSSIQENLYQDPQWQSSLKVVRNDGGVQVEGIIDSKRRIKPLLQSERSSRGQVLHSIYEVHEISDYASEPAPAPESFLQSDLLNAVSGFSNVNVTARTSEAAESFTVELHVISDEYHQKHFGPMQALIEYISVMVTAVNLRFQSMLGLHIRFKLVGTTRSYDDTFATLLVGVLDTWRTLEGLVQYIKHGHVYGSFDALYLMSGRDLASIRSNGYVDKNVAGLAYVGQVCTIHAVAEGEDVARSYAGVHTMAHELAHTLGATHDPKDSSNCSWSQGFLMSYEDKGANKYRLSDCSQDEIRKVFKSLEVSCIQETATITFSTKNNGTLPGKKVTADKFCELKMRKYLKAKKINGVAFSRMPRDLASECKMKCCYKNGTDTWCQVTDTLDGMKCTDENTCRRGICADHSRAEK
ncbi:venom metalloproteinase BumaMPs1-like isoform X2 [Rhipicephalus microplus]|uniref:venom metalloproteinase BumaMPs1-like isoform X2 n=1 Tax=Rhipicephalus microplus TaxID=6941 RepID=UPI003F6CF03C